MPLDHTACADQTLIAHAKAAWDRALALGEKHGYRNAQATVIAPTGTIGLVMDCDTTGIEPDFALVKFKKLAGGGYFKIINRAVPEALRTLGYSEADIAEIEAYAVGHGTLSQAPAINHTTLKAKGFTEEAIAKVEKALPTAFDRLKLWRTVPDSERGLSVSVLLETLSFFSPGFFVSLIPYCVLVRHPLAHAR